MYKTHYIFSLLFLLISFLVQGQVEIEGKILEQKDQMMLFHFDMEQTDYQSLTLSLELIYQEDTEIIEGGFLSLQVINSEQGNVSMEFARIYPPSSEIPHHSMSYDFDLVLWQKLLSKEQDIYVFSSEINYQVQIKATLYAEKGIPPFLVKEIIPLWQYNIPNHELRNSLVENELLPLHSITLPEETKHTLIDVIISGDLEEGNPESQFYFLNINDKEIAKRSIWRDDCSSNPLYPQMDNWYLGRPNWCPGLRVHPMSHFLNKELLKSNDLEIELLFQEAHKNGKPLESYHISAVLFALDESQIERNAQIIEILAPNNSLWHQRYNPICGSPVLFIQNTGSETIKSITFNYGYNYETDTKFRWKGALEYMEEELIYLPPLNWYFFENNDQPETFTAHISAINGEKDDYVHSSKTSEMNLAEVYPSQLRFEIQTDQDAHSNGLEIFNDAGEVFFYTEELKADSLYQFNIDFKAGCYEMIFYDNDGNGLDLEDSPFLRIFDAKKDMEIRNFHPNFGAEIREQFMIFKK